LDAVRTWQEREWSEQTHPDVGAMQREISELGNEKDGFLTHKTESQWRLADKKTTIGRMGEEILGLHITVA